MNYHLTLGEHKGGRLWVQADDAELTDPDGVVWRTINGKRVAGYYHDAFQQVLEFSPLTSMRPRSSLGTGGVLRLTPRGQLTQPDSAISTAYGNLAFPLLDTKAANCASGWNGQRSKPTR